MSIKKTNQDKRSATIHQSNDSELQKNRLIPMEINREEAIEMGLAPAEIRPVKIGNRLVDGMLIPANSEEQYRGIIRDIWKEEQRTVRSRKCSISNGRGGLKRCDGDCKKCDRLKDGKALSLDRFYEENNLEFNDPADDKTDIILAIATLEDLITKLDSINPLYGRVIKMLYAGLSQRAIAATLGKPNSTAQDLIRKARLEAQRIVSREDLYR